MSPQLGHQQVATCCLLSCRRWAQEAYLSLTTTRPTTTRALSPFFGSSASCCQLDLSLNNSRSRRKWKSCEGTGKGSTPRSAQRARSWWLAAATAEPCHLSRSSAPEPSALGSLHDAKVLPPALNARSAQRRVCRLLCWQHVAMAAAFRRTQAALTWLKRCSKEVSTPQPRLAIVQCSRKKTAGDDDRKCPGVQLKAGACAPAAHT